MKRRMTILALLIVLTCLNVFHSFAQCSICTKTASQLGEKTGKGLNTGIIYLMATPFAIGIFIGYKWWKKEKMREE